MRSAHLVTRARLPIQSVSPDELPLCILIHYFVKPPIKDDVTNELFEPSSTSKQIAIFLLRELTVRLLALVSEPDRSLPT